MCIRDSLYPIGGAKGAYQSVDFSVEGDFHARLFEGPQGRGPVVYGFGDRKPHTV